MEKLFTIGYEGSDVDSLVQTLKNVGITALADVRELPLSRKKGLSKNGLAKKLADAGIQYCHFKALGDPKPGREAARRGDYKEFRKIFEAHFETESSQLAFNDLLRLATTKVTCMLCFERCAKHCHRSIIADAAIENDFEIYNLVADRPEEYLKVGIQIPRYYPSESIPAAE